MEPSSIRPVHQDPWVWRITMSRSAWTGIFCFGMVNIPSKLIPADESVSEVQRYDTLFEEIRDRNKSKRAFKIHQFMQQQHFFKSRDDFRSMPLPSKHVLQIQGFLPAREINPVCYEQSYVLLPDTGAVEPMVLLIDALSEKEVVGLGAINMHDKASLCAVHTKGGFLIVETLLLPEELSERSAKSHVNETLMDALQSLENTVHKTKRGQKPAGRAK